MPDINFQTISSTESCALMGLSQWATPKMIYRQFADKKQRDKKQSLRMKLGKLFEPMIVEAVRDRLLLEVRANVENAYVRHETLPLGATVDIDVQCPTRGFGIVESKAIDERQYQEKWTATAGPLMYEIQLQHEMLVTGATWGILAAFVYNSGDDGELYLYERRPMPHVQERIIAHATKFFADLEAGNEPPAVGNPVEMDLLNELYPEPDAKKIKTDLDNYDVAEMFRMYEWSQQQSSAHEKSAKQLKVKLLDYMGDNGQALLPTISVELKKTPTAADIVMLPADIRRRLKNGTAEEVNQAIEEACNWAVVKRAGGLQARIKIRETQDSAPAKFTDNFMAG